MRRTLFFILIFLPMLASADAIEIDGIYYNLDTETKTAEVAEDPDTYQGDVTIPDAVKYSGITYSVTTIGVAAFSGCSSLTSVTIPSSVTTIGDYAFSGCSGLTSVTIPDGVTSIGDWTFGYCRSLTSITIPDGVTSIGESAFYKCRSLTSVTIPQSVTTISNYAFSGCSGLRDMICYAENVPTTAKDAFNDSGIAKATLHVPAASVNAYQAIEPWKNFKEIVALPAHSEGDEVVEVDGILYTLDHKNMEAGVCNRTYPDMYSGDIVIPSSIVYGGNTYSVTHIEDWAFGPSYITSIIISEGVKVIGKKAFTSCYYLTSITLPKSLTTIRQLAFSGCDKLTSITIPESVTCIEFGAFAHCRSLSSVTLPNKLTKIANNLFLECESLTSITIPESVESIEYSVFARSGLTSITIPDGVKSIGNSAFVYCYDLTSVTLPNSLIEVNNNLFSWCSGLTSMTIPNNVTSIGGWAFSDCTNLTSVTIGRRVTTINQDAFKNCESLTDIYCLAESVPEIPWEIFDEGRQQEVTAHVPASSIEAYRADSRWGKFKEIVALDEPETPKDEYRPFVEDGKVWKVGDVISGSPVQCVEYYYFDGDTIIDGKTCKQMMCQGYVNPDYAESHNISQVNSLSYVGAWYEEEQKVYTYDSANKQFKLMYDFSANANDTLQIDNHPYYLYVVGPRNTGGMNGFKGVYREVRECGDEGITYRCAPWLEGVGIVYGPPTLNVLNVELADPMWFLMSCTVGDEIIYLNDACEDGATPEEINARKKRFDFTHTIKTKPKAPIQRVAEEEQSLYGEYNDQQLGINLDPLDDAYQVRITDEAGKVVYEKAVNAGNIVGLNIDISTYAKGRYTVTVENSKETFTGEFEAQTTGIEEVKSEQKDVRNKIYNLQGQRLSTLQKGLNIVNGRKVYVK